MITQAQKREATIKSIVPNLRHKWREQLAPFTDSDIAEQWEHFELSEDYPDEDKFLSYFAPQTVPDEYQK